MKQYLKITGNAGTMMGMNYFRSIPRRELKMVSSFFLLDHFFERELSPDQAKQLSAIGAHPHRGITTLTYMMQGENEHTDSLGNKAMVKTGGVQWMNSGSGIVHDEGASQAFRDTGGLFHLLQFWLVLSPEQRDMPPMYQPLQSEDIPEQILDAHGSRIRILLGDYSGVKSPLPRDGIQFLYHLSLKPEAYFYYTLPFNYELGIFAAKGGVDVNKERLEQSTLFFSKEGGRTLKITNNGDKQAEVILMGGEPYTTPIYAEGPFVMGNREGIKKAYQDYYDGKYGNINNNKRS